MGQNPHHNTITLELDDSKWNPLLAGHNIKLYLFYSARLSSCLRWSLEGGCLMPTYYWVEIWG